MARTETLKREAQEKLKVGTNKEAIVRFFAENNIPLTFTRSEASGAIPVVGCAPKGCGSDAAILGVRVEINETGTVISPPVVGGIYSDCL
jgi:hypothetical protein